MEAETCKYRWIILAGAFVNLALTWGLLYSVGVLYKVWISYFNSPASYVSLAGALPVSIGCITGPLYGFLGGKFGFRKCGIMGGFIMASGWIISSFAESVQTLCFTFGAITGFGAGMVAFSTSAIINDYFVRHRLLAEGFMGAGLCFGNFLFSVLQQQLLNNYQWRGALLITGGVCFNACVVCMCFIPGIKIKTHPFNFWPENDMPKYKLPKHNHKEINDKKTEFQSSPVEEKASCLDKTNKLLRETTRNKNNFASRSLQLFSSPVFWMLLISDFLSWTAIYVPYVHLVKRGKLSNLSEDTSAWLSSTVGVAGFVGRPLTGVIGSYFQIHPLWCYVVIQMSCGFATFFSSFWSNTYGLFIFAAMFGFLSNGYGMIKASVALMLGKDCFVDAFSWMLLEEGIGIILGPVLAGFIYDATQSYSWSFRFSGSLLVLSALICFLKPLAEKCEKKIIQHQ
ncbi:unnamed protein product [Clavelina lepadiformis]|uniref:Major facilitator superfamily (MFS) profile domain-containing protein n=1 Tax=Clavelina lepadiformis TaxID=159417 RepID=A0ABP0GD06_CLALP